MGPKGSRKNLMNILLISLIAIIVVGVAYVLISDPAETPEILTVDVVVDNYEEYLGEEIIVEGYYYHETYPLGEGVITSVVIESGQTSGTGVVRLPVNHLAVNASLADRVKYRFVGVLEYDSSIPIPINAIVLMATEIMQV